MPYSIIVPSQPKVQVFSVASKMAPSERQALAIETLAKTEPISDLAKKNGVSRKFLYKQAGIAQQALQEGFKPKKEESEVLFYLPVTRAWLHQFVLVLILVCHSSFRGIIKAASALLHTHMSLGTIHNIVRETVESAREINSQEDLSPIKVGAHDEIFQSGKPVLVGVDAHSTYCYLLALEEARDGDTWGVHLLDLEGKGLALDHTIADGGKGLRAGQKEAWPEIPCHGDVFHPLYDMGKLCRNLENRAMGAIATCQKLENRMGRAKKKAKGNKFSKKLAAARASESKFVELAAEVAILYQWMRRDILSLIGPKLETRQEMFDFIVLELKKREHLLERRIKPVRKALENQRDHLLAFAALMDKQLEAMASEYRVSIDLLRGLCKLQGFSEADNRRWPLEGKLRKGLRGLFHPLRTAIQNMLNQTVRASSIVENLNSRLRNYFFLRKQLGPEYLDLLRFFLNHQTFMRSERPERVGKSPAELLSGKKHPHWLEMLGFELFKQAA